MMLAGPTVWACVFLGIYVSESLVCSRLGDPRIHAAIVACTCGLGLAMLLMVALRSARLMRSGTGDEPFYGQAALVLAALSILAVGWLGLPALLLPACSG